MFSVPPSLSISKDVAVAYAMTNTDYLTLMLLSSCFTCSQVQGVELRCRRARDNACLRGDRAPPWHRSLARGQGRAQPARHCRHGERPALVRCVSREAWFAGVS